MTPWQREKRGGGGNSASTLHTVEILKKKKKREHHPTISCNPSNATGETVEAIYTYIMLQFPNTNVHQEVKSHIKTSIKNNPLSKIGAVEKCTQINDVQEKARMR